MRVSVHRRNDTGRWEARWREGGRRRSKSFERKGDADMFAANQERRLQLGVDYDAGSETLAEFMRDYWRSYAIPNLAPRTRAAYKRTWAVHILPRLGQLELREITPAVVEDFCAQLQQQHIGDPTIIKALAVLQGILARAVVRGRIPANPVREIRKPKQRRTRTPQPLAPATVEAIRAQLAHRDATLVSVMAYQGLRPHEATSLQVEQIGPRSFEVTDHKRGRTRRVNWLAPVQRDVREWLMASGIRTGPVFPRPRGDWSDTDWRNWRRRVYQPAAKQAGVTGDMRAYRLRGSFVSLLLWEGRSVAYVARQAGHGVDVLARYYAGVLEELEGAPRVSAADAILAARAALVDAQRTRETG